MEHSLCKSNFVNINGIRLHYLDWGGEGPILLFLTGMGCSVYIYDGIAPRFTDKFHVIGLDRRGHGDSDYPETGYDADTLTEDLRQFLDMLKIDQVILVGHSMGYIELTHYAALYPDRVLKLIYLDAAYGNSFSGNKAIWDKNPLPKIQPGWPKDDTYTMEEYIAIEKRNFPSQALIWNDAFDEQTRHTLRITSKGKVVDKMTNAIFTAINKTIADYEPEYSKLRTPVLSFFAIRDGSDYLASDTMTEEQQEQVTDFFKTMLRPYQKKYIEQFQRTVPQARIVEIPRGHHYCFIKQADIVFNEMSKFLSE